MIPHSYATDTQSKATELASTVAAAVSPPQIASACAAVESFLSKHAPDQQRWFFSVTFPALICRIFGFDDSSPPSATTKRNGWIDVATSENDSELSGMANVNARKFQLLISRFLVFIDCHLVLCIVQLQHRFAWGHFYFRIQYGAYRSGLN